MADIWNIVSKNYQRDGGQREHPNNIQYILFNHVFFFSTFLLGVRGWRRHEKPVNNYYCEKKERRRSRGEKCGVNDRRGNPTQSPNTCMVDGWLLFECRNYWTKNVLIFHVIHRPELNMSNSY